MTVGIVTCKQQKSTGDDESTLTLKLMARVIPGPKQDNTKWTFVQQKV